MISYHLVWINGLDRVSEGSVQGGEKLPRDHSKSVHFLWMREIVGRNVLVSVGGSFANEWQFVCPVPRAADHWVLRWTAAKRLTTLPPRPAINTCVPRHPRAVWWPSIRIRHVAPIGSSNILRRRILRRVKNESSNSGSRAIITLVQLYDGM